MGKVDRISGIVLLVFGFGIFFKSITYPIGSFHSPGGGLFPLLASIILISLSAILTVQAFMKKGGEGPAKAFFPGKETPKRIIFSFLALLGFRYLLLVIGFACSTFLFIFFLAKVLGHYGWKASILFSLLTAVIAYYLFEVWLKIPMPRSIIRI